MFRLPGYSRQCLCTHGHVYTTRLQEPFIRLPEMREYVAIHPQRQTGKVKGKIQSPFIGIKEKHAPRRCRRSPHASRCTLHDASCAFLSLISDCLPETFRCQPGSALSARPVFHPLTFPAKNMKIGWLLILLIRGFQANATLTYAFAIHIQFCHNGVDFCHQKS